MSVVAPSPLDHPTLSDDELCHVAWEGRWQGGGCRTLCGLFIVEGECPEGGSPVCADCGRPRCPECEMLHRDQDARRGRPRRRRRA